MFKFFNGGPRQLQPKPVSLSDLADNVLIAQQAYERALDERHADMQDARNKLTQKPLLPAPQVMLGAPPDHAAEMQSELEAIAKQ